MSNSMPPMQFKMKQVKHLKWHVFGVPEEHEAVAVRAAGWCRAHVGHHLVAVSPLA